jgi:hypothetical protein
MRKWILGLASFTLICSLLLIRIGLSPQVSSGFEGQGQNLPTATFLPTDNLEYTIELIQAEHAVQVFPDETIDGFSIQNLSYISRYPAGLEFKLTILPPDGEEIAAVTLLYEFAGGARGRIQAQPTAVENEWIGVPFDTHGLPPWQVMDVNFRISTISGLSVETTPVMVEYYDPTRPWWRAESQDAIVYWFDFPRELGDEVMKAIAAVRGKYEAGFGGLLSYRPRVIIFPPGDAIGEYQAGGQNNPRTTGSANNTTQSAVLRVRGLEIEDIRKDCIWNEPRDLNWQMRFAASVTTHEIAHLYQYEFFNATGPAWWIEGQATFFELDSGPFDARMRHLATYEDLSTLQGQGPSGMVGTPASDGCTHLGYEMGTSFINWLVNSYGGYDTHRQIVELMARNISLDAALEQVTGISFIELEKQWRAYLGLNPEPVIIPTPTFALPPFLLTPTATP